jgi:hypothetical protein
MVFLGDITPERLLREPQLILHDSHFEPRT